MLQLLRQIRVSSSPSPAIKAYLFQALLARQVEQAWDLITGLTCQISPTLGVPLNAVYVTITFVFLISIINIGSSVAFTQVLSLGVSAMLSTYMISIFCVALKRIRGEPLLPSKFDLGKWGLATNIISLVFLLFLFIFAFFPPAPNPTPASMNWAVMTYGVVVIFAIVYYVIRGRHAYVGPVEYVRKGQ